MTLIVQYDFQLLFSLLYFWKIFDTKLKKKKKSKKKKPYHMREARVVRLVCVFIYMINCKFIYMVFIYMVNLYICVKIKKHIRKL